MQRILLSAMEKVYVPRTFREKKDQKNKLLNKDDDFVDDNG